MKNEELTIETSLTIDADQGRVWTFLTEPTYVAQWLGCMRYEKAIGHVFYMQQDATRRNNDDIEGATHCEILALDEPELFSFSWYLPGTPATVVHIRVTPKGDASEVTLTHEGWDQFDANVIRDIRDALAGGWKSFVLPNLKNLVETEG